MKSADTLNKAIILCSLAVNIVTDITETCQAAPLVVTIPIKLFCPQYCPLYGVFLWLLERSMIE